MSLIGVNFTNNDGLSGGAVFIGSSSDVNIVECHFRNNFASSSGGAVFIDSVSMIHVTNGSFYDDCELCSGEKRNFTAGATPASV